MGRKHCHHNSLHNCLLSMQSFSVSFYEGRCPWLPVKQQGPNNIWSSGNQVYLLRKGIQLSRCDVTCLSRAILGDTVQLAL